MPQPTSTTKKPKGKNMNTEAIQTQLNEAYQLLLDRKNLNFCESDLAKLSAPFLLKLYPSYFEQKRKIIFAGKETNKWLDKHRLLGLCDKSISIEEVVNRYGKQKEFSGTLGGNRGKFMKMYQKIRKRLGSEQPGSIVWNNVLKFDWENGKSDSSRNAKKYPEVNAEIQRVSKKLWQKELEILNPDIIIFGTGWSYDKIIKAHFENKIETIEIIEKKALWKFRINGKILAYRTYHPNATNTKSQKKPYEYYNDIFSDIENAY
jgi:hypothetical protein